MNNYAVYHHLCMLNEIFNECNIKNPLTESIAEATGSFDSEKYRVAVMGESKRGKSSLINALLGTELLPVDILPCTAVNCRIVHSLQKKMVIQLKDGTSRESDIEEIRKYNREEIITHRSENIKEIVIHYPTVYGNSNIQFIDTPGFNEDETAVKAIIDSLCGAETVIFVVSAAMPLSVTEQQAVCEIIKQPHISNVIFAVSFIDRVSDKKKEQDRLTEKISQRIYEDTYEYFCRSNSEFKELLSKAERILRNPVVLPVSSKQAMNAFIKSSERLLEKSRIGCFKQMLFSVLTADREKERIQKIEGICSQTENVFGEYVAERIAAEDEAFAVKRKRKELLEPQLNGYRSFSKEALTEYSELIPQTVYSAIAEKYGSDGFVNEIKKIYISHISSIRCFEFTDEVLGRKLNEAKNEAASDTKKILEKICAEASELTEDTYKKILSFCDNAIGEDESLTEALSYSNCGLHLSFDFPDNRLLLKMGNKYDNCISHITERLNEAYADFSQAAIKYADIHKKRMSGGINLITKKTEEELHRLNEEITAYEKDGMREGNMLLSRKSEIREIIKKLSDAVGC